LEKDPSSVELELFEVLRNTVTPMIEIAPKTAFHGNDFDPLTFFRVPMQNPQYVEF
jgi:hypothetical protein|tara:strand:- start:610 stop:777 length:168 start_codon:yes stop_codon:yes gene_type:complete